MTGLPYAGAAKRLAPGDLEAIARSFDLDPAAVRAVMRVETAGSGFDAHGRPSMLFEPHVFYAILSLRSDSVFHQAVAGGLAYPVQGERPYPADSYPRLIAACALDRDAAEQSASWGLGQVLGQNYRMAGFANVGGMVAAACDSEEAQARMMMTLVVNAGWAPLLRAKNWPAFAQRYNGPNAVRNGYAASLAAAYAAPAATTPFAARPAPAVASEADNLNARVLAGLPLAGMTAASMSPGELGELTGKGAPA